MNELDEHGLSPLHIAVISGNLEMIRLLLWKDADVDIKNETGNIFNRKYLIAYKIVIKRVDASS